MEFLGFELANILSWIIVGSVVGLVLTAMDKGKVKGGLSTTLTLGVLGAIAAGILASVMFRINPRDFEPMPLLIAAGGALLAVILHRAIFRDNSHIKTETTRM
jgi:uncharacterized membrane protein YeaQ/YmgE (transglycosylase-associated protein family)